MKKIFTLVLALMGFAAATNAATVDDLAVLKHSYVLVCDQLGARPGKGVLFGNDHFLDVTGGSVATNKGQVDLSVVDALGEDGTPLYVTQDIVDKYGADYVGPHYNWLRLKNNQDVIAMKLTAKSKVIMFIQGNNKTGKDARIPCIAKTVDDIKNKTGLNAAPDENHPSTVSGFRWEYTVDDDGLYYFGSYNGDMFVSFIIIEANEAPGTPTVKVGDQTFEGGLWFREVSCKANPATEEGSTEKIPTIVTYTTDGTMPTATSPVYTEPIKCYQNMTVKFQAFLDFGDHTPSADFICDGADNEGNVNFTFSAPTITVDGANVTITTPYAEQNGTNFYTLNGGDATKGDAATLTESATVVAYTEIANGNYGKFTSMSSSKDAYVLNAIKEKKTIAITSADVVVDEEATASATDGSTVYKVENGAISADKMDFFVKNLTFNVLKDAKAQYQVPEGQEAYIQMSNTNIVFKVAAGDKVKVKVVCSKNSCKNIDADDAAEDKLDNGCTPDRQCYVNVSGTNYCLTDAEGNHTNDLKLYPDANVFEFELAGGKNVTTKDEEGNETTTFEAADTYYTFQKYSGTGNILISSIEIEPADAAGIQGVKIVNAENDAIFNLAGQRVDTNYKGVVIMNGKKVILK
ncbi:MAG: chitobiase/beta-hexosaminidase C-terminal domain-containing protein [Prevotella sp.]|nr:chitobiase/beta-hexosaminidase C-terminal domain-containing protein [Prevotella sp.]